MRLKWLGHASWKIKAGGKTIYVDPYQGEYDEKADLILSTHSVIVAPADCAAKIGATVKSLKPGEKATFGEVTVEAVEAYNFKRFRSPGVPFHPKGLGVGYLIRSGGKTIYHVGDSDFIPEMKDLKGVDLLLIPSGGTYTMDNEDAAEATVAIHPKAAVPIHIWDTDPGAFKRKVESVSDVKVVVMRPGETYEI